MSPASIGCNNLLVPSVMKELKLRLSQPMYIWKIMVTAIDGKHQKCKMGRLVNGRRSVRGDQNLMPNNIRNVFSVGVAETTITEQKQGSLLDVASNVHDAISKIRRHIFGFNRLDRESFHLLNLSSDSAVLC
ncbi:hypothetical protein POTOM_012014 [Populus tomentosa]|uniref:Uncharacterized protein n=1 Tax=Populus tomentosa TaxID=118781 RepID=A0A8X8D8R7_POPTO|nr:hypothetical protein POTOM_012014 [Populus tomentosa]